MVRDAQHYIDIVNSVSFTGGLKQWGMRLVPTAVGEDPDVRICVDVYIDVLDTTAEDDPTRLAKVGSWPKNHGWLLRILNASKRPFEDRLFEAIRNFAVHEALESFHVGGRQFHDPHAKYGGASAQLANSGPFFAARRRLGVATYTTGGGHS